MKKVLSVLVAVLLLCAISLPAYADGGEIDVYLDAAKIEFDVKPQIVDGRTMVPIRAIFEAMGAAVKWDDSTKTAICTKSDTVVKIALDSTNMYINDELIKMDVSPVIVDGRTFVPARYAAEAFGANVQWSRENNAVVICSKDVYAYADYPDIPDLGKCYNIPASSEKIRDGFKIISYIYDDTVNEDYYSYLYDNSALVLGNYAEDVVDSVNGVVKIAYTKSGEIEPRYFIDASYDENGLILFDVKIPLEELAETAEKKVTLYAPDGRTADVAESEAAAYLNVGWYKTLEEIQQTMYAPDGRTITVYKAEVSAYKSVGWYETQAEAFAAEEKAKKATDTGNRSADGYYYRTPYGKRYHLDPDCGGKNSYRTTNISGLTPCAKCAK